MTDVAQDPTPEEVAVPTEDAGDTRVVSGDDDANSEFENHLARAKTLSGQGNIPVQSAMQAALNDGADLKSEMDNFIKESETSYQSDDPENWIEVSIDEENQKLKAGLGEIYNDSMDGFSETKIHKLAGQENVYRFTSTKTVDNVTQTEISYVKVEKNGDVVSGYKVVTPEPTDEDYNTYYLYYNADGHIQHGGIEQSNGIIQIRYEHEGNDMLFFHYPANGSIPETNEVRSMDAENSVVWSYTDDEELGLEVNNADPRAIIYDQNGIGYVANNHGVTFTDATEQEVVVNKDTVNHENTGTRDTRIMGNVIDEERDLVYNNANYHVIDISNITNEDYYQIALDEAIKYQNMADAFVDDSKYKVVIVTNDSIIEGGIEVKADIEEVLDNHVAGYLKNIKEENGTFAYHTLVRSYIDGDGNIGGFSSNIAGTELVVDKAIPTNSEIGLDFRTVVRHEIGHYSTNHDDTCTCGVSNKDVVATGEKMQTGDVMSYVSQLHDDEARKDANDALFNAIVAEQGLEKNADAQELLRQVIDDGMFPMMTDLQALYGANPRGVEKDDEGTELVSEVPGEGEEVGVPNPLGAGQIASAVPGVKAMVDKYDEMVRGEANPPSQSVDNPDTPDIGDVPDTPDTAPEEEMPEEGNNIALIIGCSSAALIAVMVLVGIAIKVNKSQRNNRNHSNYNSQDDQKTAHGENGVGDDGKVMLNGEDAKVATDGGVKIDHAGNPFGDANVQELDNLHLMQQTPTTTSSQPTDTQVIR